MPNKIYIPKRKQSKLSPTADNPTSASKKTRSSAPLHLKPVTSEGQVRVRETGPDEIGSSVASDLGQDVPTQQERGGTTSPCTETLKTRGSVWKGLEKAMRALHVTAEVIPPVQSAVGGLVSCLEHFEVAHKNQECYDEVIMELSEISEYLNQHLKDPRSEGLIGRISDISKAVDVEIQEVRKLQAQSKTTKVLGAMECEEDLARRFRQIGVLFRRIQMEINMSEWSIEHEKSVNERLKELAPARLAQYNSGISDAIGRRACTEDTRTDTLAKIEEWCDNPSAPMIYWMDGMAGTGKTTIAYTLAKHLESCHQLGASFFCTVTSEECRQASRIIPTIAYQLSQRSTPFKAAVGRALKNNPDSPVLTIPKQMERLLIHPSQEIKDELARNLIIVIDALDECDDANVVGLILKVLIGSAGQFPFRFFITSRPEPAIYNRLSVQPDDLRSVLHLHEISESSVQNDIKMYLSEGLAQIQPSGTEVEQLTTLSGRLFIYAATVVRYIVPDNVSVDSRARLRTMLDTKSKSTKKHSGIDALYTTILSRAIDNDDLEPDERDSILYVVWAVVRSDGPISLVKLGVQSGLCDEQAVLASLGPLRSVLHISQTAGTVSTFHASFSQFIFDQARSVTFFCHETRAQQIRFLSCLKVFKSGLHSLPQSDSTISPYVAFAGRNWVGYLTGQQCWTNGVPEQVYTELGEMFQVVIGLRKWLMNRHDMSTRRVPAFILAGKLGAWLKEVGGPTHLHKVLGEVAPLLDIIDHACCGLPE